MSAAVCSHLDTIEVMKKVFTKLGIRSRDPGI
jgi:hypothetical protein